MGRFLKSILWLFPLQIFLSAAPCHAADAGTLDMGSHLGLWTVIPFTAMLLAIAMMPIFAPHWWERNLNKTVLTSLLALPIAAYVIVAWGHSGVELIADKVKEYLSFMVLLATLFVIAGGIYVQGSLSGTPLLNSGILAFGALLSNAIGTTGASVLLIRPLLRANIPRERKAHIVVFFIFMVSNCGGLLTPLGDPPLFLGFLKGVPFEWTLRLWREWLLVNGILLVMFNIWDQVVLDWEERVRPGSQLEEVQKHEPLRVDGLLNLVFLLGVLVTIYASGRGLGTRGEPWPFGAQEGIMLALAVGAYTSTSPVNRARNKFTWGPIVEVAVLFAGIFVTMAPALLILNAWGQGHRSVLGFDFGLTQPWQFFWMSGSLSSFLDNAPTYLTFSATACGLTGLPVEGRYLGSLLDHAGGGELLAAIACGAVFMGANTYIGNGPNFMVKAIAEENGVSMPGFFGYMSYSACILLPIFALVTVVFFA